MLTTGKSSPFYRAVKILIHLLSLVGQFFLIITGLTQAQPSIYRVVQKRTNEPDENMPYLHRIPQNFTKTVRNSAETANSAALLKIPHSMGNCGA